MSYSNTIKATINYEGYFYEDFWNHSFVIAAQLTLQTGYCALLYKVEIATGTFFICLGITLFVLIDGGIDNKNRK